MPDVARASSERGELVLRRRDCDDALELRVNGVFVMDTCETTTERLLATRALDALSVDVDVDVDAVRVFVGGLGLGYTVQALLEDPRVGQVVVAEIEPDLIEWHRRGLVPPTHDAVVDSRVELRIGDVRAVAAGLPMATFGLVLLDVDNGPGFLVYDDNAGVYEEAFLRTCHRICAPEGLTVVWSSDAAPALAETMASVFGHCEEASLPVTLGTRETAYHLLLARRHAERARGPRQAAPGSTTPHS